MLLKHNAGLQCHVNELRKKNMEMPGIEPGAFHMQSERSTAELHPRFGQNTLYATCDHMHACNWQQTYVSREQTGRFIHVGFIQFIRF